MDTTNFVLPEHREYLQKLRDEGVIDMGQADIHLQREFGLPSPEARLIVKKWLCNPT